MCKTLQSKISKNKYDSQTYCCCVQILFPSEKDVFYNPVQEFNRDLTIAVIKQFSKPLLDEKGLADSQPGVHNKDGITVLEVGNILCLKPKPYFMIITLFQSYEFSLFSLYSQVSFSFWTSEV